MMTERGERAYSIPLEAAPIGVLQNYCPEKP
jgi:hypothetical protein